MEIVPGHAAERAKELLRDPARYFAEARERAERALGTRRCHPGTHQTREIRRDAPPQPPDEETLTWLACPGSEGFPTWRASVHGLVPSWWLEVSCEWDLPYPRQFPHRSQ